MGDYVTIQIQLNPDKHIPDEQIQECEEVMNEACAKLEKLGYVHAVIFKNDRVWMKGN